MYSSIPLTKTLFNLKEIFAKLFWSKESKAPQENSNKRRFWWSSFDFFSDERPFCLYWQVVSFLTYV